MARTLPVGAGIGGDLPNQGQTLTCRLWRLPVMARWSVAVLVLLLASGCLQAAEEDDGGGPGASSSTSASTSASASATSTRPAPVPVPDEWTPGAWVNGTCPDMVDIMAPYFFHDLAVRVGDRIAVLRNGAQHRYEVLAEGAEGTRFLAAAPGAVFAAKDADLATGRVVRYDATLEEVASVEVGQVGSLLVDRDVLYVGGLGRFTTLSLDLQVLDVLDLSGTAVGGKRIDFITVHHRGVGDVVAYLVDDVLVPYRLYRVDVTDPARLVEGGNHTVFSSTSPGPQWIDHQAKQWYVQTNFYGRGVDGTGSQHEAVAIGLDGVPDGKPVPLHSTWTTEAGTVRETGYELAASTWYLPGWAVLHGNGSRMLSHVTFQNGVPSHACDTPMGANDGPVHLASDYSWFVAAAGDHLWYIDPSRGPSVARSQDLPFVPTGLAVLS